MKQLMRISLNERLNEISRSILEKAWKLKIHFTGTEATPGMMTETRCLSAMSRSALFCIFVMAISIILIQRAGALEFSLDAPEQVETGQEFDARITSGTTDIYDAKIFVYQGDKNIYVSKIYDGTA